MTPGRSLTGRWVGFYVQHDHQRAISADLVQEGDRITGSMHDEQTRFELSVFEMAVETGLPPGADEQITSWLRSQFPDQAGAPIRASMGLPSESRVSGRVQGRTVTLVKTYQGEAFSGYHVGDQRVGVSVQDHRVHYRGTIAPDGNALEGTWHIDADPKIGVRRTEGAFVLRRA